MWQNNWPSPVMVTSPYDWKIIEWDVKPQTNKLGPTFSFNFLTIIINTHKDTKQIHFKSFTNILYIYKTTPSLDIYFAIWTTGVHVFKMLYLKNKTSLFAYIILSSELLFNWLNTHFHEFTGRSRGRPA